MAIATQQTVTGTATAANSVAPSSWTPSANDLILVWVACRSGVKASSVSGNGITFTKVIEDLETPQNQCTLSLWRGMSASPSTGAITASLSGTANAAVIQAHRISGAITTGTNGADAIGASAIANTGATDTNAPSVTLTTTAANSRCYGGATHRSQVYSAGSGETAISLNITAGTAGDTTSLSTEYQDVASASSVTINGSLVSATDWIQGAVEILAAPTVITGDAALTQGADTLSATGTVDIAGSASLTQGADTSSGAGAVAIVGSASLTQGADTLLANGGLPAILGDAALTQGADTLSATGTVDIAGSASLTQGADTSSGAGAVAIVGSASLTQGADTLTSDGSVAIALAPYRRHRYRVAAAAPAQIPAVGRRFVVPPSAEAQL